MSCEGLRFGHDFTIQVPSNSAADRLLYYSVANDDLREVAIDQLVGIGIDLPTDQIAVGAGTNGGLNSSNFFTTDLSSFVSINNATPDASAIFQVDSTTQGFLGVPRMTQAERDLIATPATGLQVYNSDSNEYEFYNGSSWQSFTDATTGTADTLAYFNGSGNLASSGIGYDGTVLSIPNQDFLSVGSFTTAQETGLANTYIWYNSVTGKFRGYEGGAAVNLVTSSGGGTLPSFTQYYVPFGDASGSLTESSNFQFDSASSKLTVQGNSTTTGNMFELYDSGGTNGYKFSNNVGFINIDFAASTDTLFIGEGYTGTGNENVIIGNNVATSLTTSTDVVVIGTNANSIGGNAVVIGSGSSGSAGNTVVIGHAAIANNGNSVVIGRFANGGQGQVIIGVSANGGGGSNGTSIGYQTNLTGSFSSVAVGFQATVTGGFGGVAIGNSATTYNGGVAIGQNASSVTNSIALGNGATVATSSTIVVGGDGNGVTSLIFGEGETSASAVLDITFKPTPTTLAATNGADFIVMGGVGTSSNGSFKISQTGGTVNLESNDTGLGFFAATPIAQPSTTGETTGFTAGAGTGVNDDSTFTGNVGATAYRISDIVKHLKNLGLISS